MMRISYGVLDNIKVLNQFKKVPLKNKFIFDKVIYTNID